LISVDPPEKEHVCCLDDGFKDVSYTFHFTVTRCKGRKYRNVKPDTFFRYVNENIEHLDKDDVHSINDMLDHCHELFYHRNPYKWCPLQRRKAHKIIANLLILRRQLPGWNL
jgi:hypothetical protein